MIVEYIDAHRDRFRVEPICLVLTEHAVKIAPSTYYAAKTRPRSARAVRDDAVLERIKSMHGDRTIGRGLSAGRRVVHQLRREGRVDGRPVSR